VNVMGPCQVCGKPAVVGLGAEKTPLCQKHFDAAMAKLRQIIRQARAQTKVKR
jgi:hypothetical protein